MRSPTVAPAKPTWRVASMLARRRYLGCRDELRRWGDPAGLFKIRTIELGVSRRGRNGADAVSD
jgi:hypothetical protein